MKTIEILYPLLYHPIQKIEFELNKQISLDLKPNAIKQSSFELLGHITEVKELLEQNFVVTNVNFQQIVRNLYQQDNSLESIQLNILIKDCENYSRIAYQHIPLFKFKNANNEN